MPPNRKRDTPLKDDYIAPAQCSPQLRLEILAQVPFFADLPHPAIEDINSRFRDFGYTEGETIYTAGEQARYLYVVATGHVKLVRHTRQGQDVVLEVLKPGEFFGSLAMLGDTTYPNTAQAQTPVCALRVAADDFQYILATYPPVAQVALDITARRLQAAQNTIQQLSTAPVEQRIAILLLKLAAKLGEEQDEGLVIQMPLSRQDIAEMTGTTAETASRVISRFTKDQLIRSGRRWVALLDQPGLEKIAQGQATTT